MMKLSLSSILLGQLLLPWPTFCIPVLNKKSDNTQVRKARKLIKRHEENLSGTFDPNSNPTMKQLSDSFNPQYNFDYPSDFTSSDSDTRKGSSPLFSLSHLEGSNDQNPRAAALEAKRVDFINGNRFHSVNGAQLSIVRGPQPTAAVLNLTQQELADLARRPSVNVTAIGQTLGGGIASGQIPIATLDDVANMYRSIESIIEFPFSAKDWNSDLAFAQNHLTVFGTLLQKVKTVPSSFSVPNVESITGGDSLNTLIDQDRLFEIDLSFAGQYPRSNKQNGFDNYYTPGSHALFYIDSRVGDEGTFMPLAIHIVESGLTYTPQDTENDWTFAKMAFAAGEMNYEPMIHFIDRHMTLEPIRVEMFRYLSPRHPIHALLEHHFKNLFGNTVLAFQVLFLPGTFTDQVFGWRAKGLTEFVEDEVSNIDWSNQNVPFRFETRGLMDIPGYKVRDDLLDLRRIIRRFIKNVLDDYYIRRGRDVRQDFELQNFLAACADPTQGGVTGFPSRLGRFRDVVELVTDIITSVTIQHHAVNSFTGWNAVTFPLFGPSLWAPLPTTKGGPIPARAYLPPPNIMVQTAGLTAAFYRPLSLNETISGSYDNGMVLGDGSDAKDAVNEFQMDMARLSRRIERRERDEARPYTLMDPNRLPYFIWI